jgi:hypothetical protein
MSISLVYALMTFLAHQQSKCMAASQFDWQCRHSQTLLPTHPQPPAWHASLPWSRPTIFAKRHGAGAFNQVTST